MELIINDLGADLISIWQFNLLQEIIDEKKLL
jgi:hypothetical protein